MAALGYFHYRSNCLGECLDKRKQEAERIRTKYNDRIPASLSVGRHQNESQTRVADDGFLAAWWFNLQVICEKVDKSDIEDIDKKKYLVPAVSPVWGSIPLRYLRLDG